VTSHRRSGVPPRIDIRIPTRDPAKFYQWGTMEGVPPAAISHPHEIRRRVRARVWGRPHAREVLARAGPLLRLVFLTDVETGEPLAIITTASCSTCASRGQRHRTAFMAREDCGTLGLLGSGGMATSHVEALLEVRSSRSQVFSRRGRTASALQPRSRSATGSSAKPSIRRARYIGARTFSRPAPIPRSVIAESWLEAGMHVISIGGRPD